MGESGRVGVVANGLSLQCCVSPHLARTPRNLLLPFHVVPSTPPQLPPSCSSCFDILTPWKLHFLFATLVKCWELMDRRPRLTLSTRFSNMHVSQFKIMSQNKKEKKNKKTKKKKKKKMKK